MKPETRNVLLKAYTQLQVIIDEIYEAHDNAVANDQDLRTLQINHYMSLPNSGVSGWDESFL